MRQLSPTEVHLLAVMGSSPAVVTETLFCLAVSPAAGHDPRRVAAVDIVTTTLGREYFLASVPSALAAMARDYPDAADRLPLGADTLTVSVPRRPGGAELDDIRDTTDAARVADMIVQLTRRLTGGQLPVHASLAGGRKTMSYCLGQAMSLWARPSDRLSHVLVSDPADRCRGFFYPPPTSTPMTAGGGESFDAAQMKVQLHEVAFPRLRQRLEGVAAGATFWDTMAEAQARLAPLPIRINFCTGSLQIGDAEPPLTPVQKTLFMILAVETKAGRPVERAELSDPARGRLAAVARWIYDDLLQPYERQPFFDIASKNDDFHGPLRTQLSKIRGALRTALPETIADLYSPSSGRGDILLKISPDLIEVVGGDAYEALRNG